MIHQRLISLVLILGGLALPLLGQSPGLYLKFGAHSFSSENWKYPEGAEHPPNAFRDGIGFSDDEVRNAPFKFLHRGEVGGEWPLRGGFGLRVGCAALRIPRHDFGWQQAFLDVLWNPWQGGRVRVYASAGMGFGTVSGRYVVRSEAWVPAGDAAGYRYVPGEYRPMSQSSRPFLRVSTGIQLSRFFALEANADLVSLARGKENLWPSTESSVGLNLVLRRPLE